jgi:hypothetical protein
MSQQYKLRLGHVFQYAGDTKNDIDCILIKRAEIDSSVYPDDPDIIIDGFLVSTNNEEKKGLLENHTHIL